MGLIQRAGALATVLVVLLSVDPASAADRKNILPEAGRQVDGGRSVQVLVAQEEIKSDINKSNLAVAAGGGLLMALIDAGVEAERAKKAEAAILPLRTALQGYDVDALAQETTQSVADQTTWLQPAATSFSRDSSVLAKSGVLDNSASSQVAFFEYAYDTSPDFSSLRVAVNIQFANKANLEGKKPEARLQPKQLAYAQTITSVVSLPSPQGDADANVARWSADDGKLARKAIATGFDQLRILTPRALALADADAKSMSSRDKKNVVLGGFGGRLQEETPTGSLLFNGALVHVQTLAE